MIRLLPFFLLACWPCASVFAQLPCSSSCTPIGQCGSIAVSGGLCIDSPSFFCEGEIVCVENNSDPASFDQWLVWWDDGTCDTYPNTTLSATHTYNFPDSCLEAGFEGISPAILIKNVRFCGPNNMQVSRNCVETYLLIKINPVASISVPNKLCVGQEACFTASGCENADTATYIWHIDGTFAGTGLEACKTFNTKGPHTVRLIMTNECGADTVLQTVNVRDVPVAVSAFSFSDTVGCIPTMVALDDQSSDYDQILWSVSPATGTMFVSSILVQPDTMLKITKADTYIIRHIAKNVCGADTTFLTVTTHDVPMATLAPIDPACDTLDVTPAVTWAGSIDMVQWFLNGALTHTFNTPQAPTYHLGEGNYTIKLVATGPCGTVTQTQPVIVTPLSAVTATPVPTLCQSSEPVALEANQPGVVFSGPGVSGSVAMGYTFNPAAPGVVLNANTINFMLQGAGDCDAAGSLQIMVQSGPAVNVPPPFTICRDAGPQPLTANPSDGEWSGDGVASGVFDPASVAPGTYTLTYRYTAPSGCLVVKTTSATVVMRPSLSATDTFTICLINQALSLQSLANIAFSPSSSTFTCSGTGVGAGCTFNPMTAGLGAHTLTFTAANPLSPDCDTTVETVVLVTPFSQAGAGPNMSVCKSEGILMLMGSPPGGTWSGSGISTDGKIVLANVPTGPHTFVYTLSSGTLCESTDNVVVTIFDGGVSVQDTVYACETDTIVSFGNPAPALGTWAGPVPVSGNMVNISTLAAGNHFFVYTVANLPDACNFDTLVLHIGQQPQVGFSFPSENCDGTPVQFTNESLGATQYLWHFGDPANSTSVLANPTFPYPAGDFTVTLDAWSVNPLTGLALCTNTFSKQIHISQAPQVVDFQMDVDTVCPGSPVVFNNLSFGESMTYAWDFGVPQVPNSLLEEPGSVTFPPQDTGAAQITILLVGENFCGQKMVTHTLTLLPLPVAGLAISFPQPCERDTVYINNTGTGWPFEATWTTNLGDTFHTYNPPILLPDFPGDVVSQFIVHLHLTNICGENDAEDSTLVYPSPITAQFSMSATDICVGDTLHLTAQSSPGTVSNWELTLNGIVQTFLGNTVAYVPTSPGPLYVLLTSEGCGSDTMSLFANALPPPTLDVVFDLLPCNGHPVNFQVITNGNGHELFFGDNDSTDLNVGQHVYALPGNYPLFATAHTPLGCKATWTGDLDIAPTPTVSIAFTDSICAKVPAIFTGEGTGVQSWDWQFCDTCFQTGQQVGHVFLTSGTHLVQLVGISQFGCRDTTERPFFVRPTPVAALELAVFEKCTPGGFVANDLSTLATGIEWQLGNGQTSSENTETFTIEEAGLLSVLLIASNDGICFDTASTTIDFYKTPSLVIEKEPSCFAIEGTRVSVMTELGNFVKMTGPDYEEEGDSHPKVPPGTYLVEAVSQDGCEAEMEVFVAPVAELFIHLAEDYFEINLGQKVPLEVFANQFNVGYLWSPAADLDHADIPDPVATPFLSTFFAVVVTNELGCFKYDTAFIRVNIDRDTNIFVPNTFTPNDDGRNDILRLRSANPGLALIKSFSVFDRWGELVFEAQDCQPETGTCGWDGNFRGQKAEMGMYVWKAELVFVDGVPVRRQGTVNLLR